MSNLSFKRFKCWNNITIWICLSQILSKILAGYMKNEDMLLYKIKKANRLCLIYHLNGFKCWNNITIWICLSQIPSKILGVLWKMKTCWVYIKSRRRRRFKRWNNITIWICLSQIVQNNLKTCWVYEKWSHVGCIQFVKSKKANRLCLIYHLNAIFQWCFWIPSKILGVIWKMKTCWVYIKSRRQTGYVCLI